MFLRQLVLFVNKHILPQIIWHISSYIIDSNLKTLFLRFKKKIQIDLKLPMVILRNGWKILVQNVILTVSE